MKMRISVSQDEKCNRDEALKELERMESWLLLNYNMRMIEVEDTQDGANVEYKIDLEREVR